MKGSSNLKNKIDYGTINNIRSFVFNYDKEIDSLIIQTKVPMPCVSVDWDGDLWVRVNPHNGEIFGVEIEDYKEFFFKKYHSILRGRAVTDPAIKELVIAILKAGSKPYTKKEFTADLEKASQRIKA